MEVDFHVSNATLNRFFSLHFVLPFLLAALALAHLIALHMDGSNNPNGIGAFGIDTQCILILHLKI